MLYSAWVFSFRSAPASRLNCPLVWNVHAHLKRMRITWTRGSTWSGMSDFAEGHEIWCWRCFIWQAGDLKSLEISKRNPLFFFSASTYCSIGLKPYEWKSSFLLSARLTPCLQGFLTHTHWPLYSVNNTGQAPIECVCVWVDVRPCVCLKISERQHLLQGRHLFSFTRALCLQSSTHPWDRMTHPSTKLLHALPPAWRGIEF